MTFKSFASTLALTLSCVCATAQTAAVDIQNSWARATVKGQLATGAFMTLTAPAGARLVAASTPVGVAQIHAMRMENDVMKMVELKDGLDLPAGKAVELKPGGYHVMLMDLKAPLTKDSQVPLTLVFKDSAGVENRIALSVPVRTSGPTMDHGAHGHMPAKP